MNNRWTDEAKRVGRLAQAHPYELALIRRHRTITTPERDPDGYAQGYWLVDAHTNIIIFPSNDNDGAALDEIEDWLRKQQPCNFST